MTIEFQFTQRMQTPKIRRPEHKLDGKARIHPSPTNKKQFFVSVTVLRGFVLIDCEVFYSRA